LENVLKILEINKSRLITENFKEFGKRYRNSLTGYNQANTKNLTINDKKTENSKNKDKNVHDSGSKSKNEVVRPKSKIIPRSANERVAYFYARAQYSAALEACEIVLAKKNLENLPDDFFNFYAMCLLKNEVNLVVILINFLVS